MNFQEVLKNPLFIKYKTQIVSGLIVGVCLCLLAFIVVPQVTKTLAKRNQTGQLEEKVLNMGQKLSVLNNINIEEYQTYANTALVILPEDKSLPESIGYLSKLLVANQLTLNNISFSLPDNSQQIKSFTNVLEVQGENTDIRKFIDDLKSAPRIFKVKSVELTSNNTPVTIAEINLLAYFNDLPTSLGPPEQKIDKVNAQDIELLNNYKNQVGIFPEVTTTNEVNVQSGKSDPFN